MTATKTMLRDWLDKSQYRGSISRFASALGVPLKTAEDWFYKGVKPHSTFYRAKLYLATGLEDYAPSSEKERAFLQKPEQTELLCLEEHIKALLDSLELLSEQLEYFKEASAEHRKTLRSRLNGTYIAYLSNLLQLLLSEERFQEWLTMSALTPLGRKGGYR